MAVFRWMRAAAHWRHAILCAVLYGDDQFRMRREMVLHQDFVNAVYSPWV